MDYKQQFKKLKCEFETMEKEQNYLVAIRNGSSSQTYSKDKLKKMIKIIFLICCKLYIV